jgi:hypothetical protein
MGMTRNELRQRIVRNLGGGMVKIELCLEAIDDAINTARDTWITWAVGDATQEVYFLLMLKGGQSVYDMPAGLIDVLSYRDNFGGVGGIGIGAGYDAELATYGAAGWYTGPEQGSTAFFSLGAGSWQGLGYGSGSGGPNGLYTMVDSYLALGHLELIQRMKPDKYQWRYHKFANKFEVIPTPECGNTLQVGIPVSGGCPNQFDGYEYEDSPGFVMIRGQMMMGSTLPTYVPSVSGTFDPDGRSHYPEADENYLESIFSHPWIIEYATFYAMRTLGYIRRKFASNTSLGNATISMDGSDLVSEATSRLKELEDELDLKYSTGYSIIMG